MQEEGKQLSRATFSVSVKKFKRSVGGGLQRDAHGLAKGDGAADGGGNDRARNGCPELCHCFCDSDDITDDGLHPKLYWHRTKTLGRGNDCCDFCLKRRDK